jgi:hypothetical protein
MTWWNLWPPVLRTLAAFTATIVVLLRHQGRAPRCWRISTVTA